MVQKNNNIQLNCPMPKFDFDRIQLSHGGGGKLMHKLIDEVFKATFASTESMHNHDSATVKLSADKIAYTTDSYVVHPLSFPGGDIGTLAVNGTVNDLAMSGARPLFMSVSFIIEEGLKIEKLYEICKSIEISAQDANVKIITGDTKVVDHGKGDGLFINTSGIGTIDHSVTIHPLQIRPGDHIIVNGDIARHGMAIMAVREGLSFGSSIESDCVSLHATIQELLDAGIDIHCLRDLTRGGLATSLNEISKESGFNIEINEGTVPVREDVASACEMLGLDPLYVANEGKFVAFIKSSDSEKAIKIIQKNSQFKEASVIGEVSGKKEGQVILNGLIGSSRILSMLSGEQLPRIC